MSHDHGRQLVRHLSPIKPVSPGFIRPSLFAGMDDDNTVDGDMQRVRILSTLESARRPVRGAPSKMRGDRRRGSTFSLSSKVLVALMGMGVLALLASFVIVVLNGHESSPRLDAAMQARLNMTDGTTAAQSTGSKAGAVRRVEVSNNPLAALIAPPAATPTAPPPAAPVTAQAEPQAAVIETVLIPPDASSVVAPPGAQAVTPATFALVPPVPAALPALDKPATTRAVKALAAEQTVAPAKPVQQTRRAQAQPRRDDDVALLEAMFTHASSARQSTVSAAEELQRRCSKLSGAEAATCRASVCVQHPSASVCHQDP